MSTSAFFTLNKYIVLEYMFSDNTSPNILPSSSTQLKRVTNTYTGVATMVNDDNAESTTGNVSQYTVQKLADGTYALLDSTTGYYYPNYDSNVAVNNLTISPSLDVVYDTMRIHILSGYNFQDVDGFAIIMSLLTVSGTEFNLCSFSFLKSDSELIYFDPNPLKISDLIYDKYIQLMIPSQNSMLNDQNLNPGNPNILTYYLTGGSQIVNQQTIYCSFIEIDTTTIKNGILYLNPGNISKFPFDSYDKFSLLTAYVAEATDGNYFEYYGQYDGAIIEEFIYAINAVAGNNFYLIHDFAVIEQQGASFVQTSSFSNVQMSNYGQAMFFRPILQTPGEDVSFSIQYTLRLFNASNGRSIFKVSTLTSTNVNAYGKQTTMLAIGNVNNPLKVYNMITNAPSYNIIDNTVNIVKTNVVERFVNQNNIVVQTNGNLTPGASSLSIVLHPFSNLLGFNILQVDSTGKQTVFPLDSVSTYQLAFIANDASKYYIAEYVNANYQHASGQIAFMVTDANVQSINFFTNNNFYIVATTPDGVNTIIGTGTYTVVS